MPRGVRGERTGYVNGGVGSGTSAVAPLEAAGDRTGQPDHRWLILGVIALAQLMVVLDLTVVNIALPSAERELGFSDVNRQWIVTAYSMSFGSLLLLGGRISDLVGRKRTFLIGLVGFALTSMLAGLAPSFEVLVAARSLQGVFGALLAPSALSLLTITFTDPEERGKAFGVYGAIAGTGGAIGLLLGGALTQYLNWRWCLFVNLIFAVIAFVAGVRLLRAGAPAERPRLDLIGTVLAAGAVFCIVYGFSEADIHAWTAPLTLVLLGAGVLLLAAFGWWMWRSADPLLPPRIVADRNRSASLITVFLGGAGMFGVFLFLTFYLQQILGYSPVRTGLAFMPMVATLGVTATVISQYLLPRVGPRPMVPVGLGLAAAGMVWMTNLDATSTYALHVMPPLLVLGVGLGLALPPGSNLATAGIAPRDAGVGSATVNTMQQVGGSVGASLLSTVAAHAATRYLEGRPPGPATPVESMLRGYSTAYWWSAGLFVAGMVLTALIYRSGPPSASPEDTPTVGAPGSRS